MNLNEAVLLFSRFLTDAWESVTQSICDRKGDFSIDDWLQVNWEIIVESSVLSCGSHLEVYGEGADVYGTSSRVIDASAKADYRILVQQKPGCPLVDLLDDDFKESSKLYFDRLVSLKDGWYHVCPPFNCILAIDTLSKVERVFDIDSVNLKLENFR